MNGAGVSSRVPLYSAYSWVRKVPPRQVECDSDVSRLLLLDQGQEHGDETVNCIGGLPGGML